jgi:DNA transposition AAA+ family ATPase
MKDVFVETANFGRTRELCDELLGPALGVELGAVTGRAGRGKTTAASRIYAINPDTVYLVYQEAWSHTETLREIAFRLCGTRPRYRDRSFEMIQTEMGHRRRLIMVDEADRMSVKCLNVLRNLHDICRAPILLIGEEDLTGKLSREGRLTSRLRKTICFDPLVPADVKIWFKRSLGQDITPDQATRLCAHAGGDFRNILTVALTAERYMSVSGIAAITDRIVEEICKNGNGGKH